MTQVVRAAPRVLFTPLPDGGVLLDLETKVYFTLNATGAALWSQLARGPSDRAALATHLVRAFDVTAERARADVDQWLAELLHEGLLLESAG